MINFFKSYALPQLSRCGPTAVFKAFIKGHKSINQHWDTFCYFIYQSTANEKKYAKVKRPKFSLAKIRFGKKGNKGPSKGNKGPIITTSTLDEFQMKGSNDELEQMMHY